MSHLGNCENKYLRFLDKTTDAFAGAIGVNDQ